jgi:hypothetical protein
MKKWIKKCVATVMVSALFVTSVYGAIILSDNAKSSEDTGSKDMVEEYLAGYKDSYNGNITYGTRLYVWSGDNEFTPKDYLPDGFLDDDEKISYSEGVIDLTPGATSPVLYKIESDTETRYEMYLFTAVSRKSSSTVRSKNQENIIYGVEKSEGFGGYVPKDYTKSGETYEADTISLVKGEEYYPEFGGVSYDTDKFVMAVSSGNVNTKKEGTYSITYRVSPVTDAQMYWYEKYTVEVTDSASDNRGTKVIADDNTIHATVTDKNNSNTEVYMGKEYNLSTKVSQITVQNLRGYDAYADIEVLKNGEMVDEDEIIKSVSKNSSGEYVIKLKSSYEDGYEIKLSNTDLMNKLINKADNCVNGGWENHMSDGIVIDSYKNSGKTISSVASDVISSFDTTVNAAVSNVKQSSALSAVSSLAISHTADEYHNGSPTGVKVFDGVQVNFSKSSLKSIISDMLSSEGLGIVSSDDIPSSMYLNCVDHGAAGYYSNQLSKSLLSYVTAYLRKDGDTYYVQLVGQFYGSGRQKLEGTSGKIPVEEQSAYLTVTKTTDAGGEDGEVDGAVYGVYSKKACEDSDRLFKLTLDKKGTATTTDKQAKKLKVNTKYYVKEITNPTGTYLNSKVYSVTTSKSGTSAKKAVKLKVSNTPWRIRVKIHKIDKTTQKDLKGVEFTVYQWNGSKYVKANAVGTSGVLTTNASGNALTGWLYYTKKNQGKWRITETKSLDGYVTSNVSKDYQIKKSNAKDSEDEALLWTVSNTPEVSYGYISVQKKVINNNGGDVSSDHSMTATFTVYSDSACKNAVTTITTNVSGFGKSKALATGKYYVKETSWGTGMEPSNESYVKTVSVTKDNTTQIVAGKNSETLGLQSEWTAGLSAKKTDSVTGKALSGAEFTFFEYNGKRYVPLTTKTTGSDGIAKIAVSEGIVRWTETNQGMFAVMETKAPDGYEINDTAMRYVTITASNKNTLIGFDEFSDTPYGWLDIQKIVTDSLGNKDMSYDLSSKALGITYGIYYDSDCTEAVTGYDNIILDASGHFKSGTLKPGTYYLKENTLNTSLFSNKAGLSVEFDIIAGQTTYLNGEYGISYDNKTWDNSIW